jgi:hypothetical protein
MLARICSMSCVTLVGLAASFAPAPSAAAAEAKAVAKGAKVTYDDQVKAIFRDKCFACHNTEKKTAGLDLTTYSGAMAGGGSGAVIEAGDSGSSYLFSLVSHTSEPHMPPKSDKLPADVLAVIQKWIDGGALENSGSKPVASKKPKVDLAIKATTGRPEGPPPMPERMSLEPVVRTTRATASRTIATNPWSPLAAVAGQKQVLLFDTRSLGLLGVLPFPEGIPQVLKFSPSGTLLLAGGGHSAASGKAVVWNVKTGDRVFEVGDELDAVLAADISADQSMIALGGPGKVVRVYSTADGSLKYEMKKHTDWIYSIAFSPDGVLLATADRNGGLIVWEANTGREYLVLGGHSSGVTGLSWRIDSNILASASEDAAIKLWEMENGAQVKTWQGHAGGVTAVDFTRDGRLVSCGRDRNARLWDQNGAAKATVSGFADIPLCIAYCDEANRILVGDWSGAIGVFNPADGKPLGALDANPPKLAERLDEATKRLAQEKARQAALVAQATAAQADVLKQHSALDAAKATLAAAEQAVQTKAQIDTYQAEHKAAAAVVAKLDPAIPPLKEAAEKAAVAAAKVAGDKELAAAVEQVKAQFAKKTAELEAAKKTVADRKALLDKAAGQLAAIQKQAAEAPAAIEAAKKQIAALTPASKTADDKAAAAKKESDASLALAANAEKDVRRWHDEIAFRDKALALAAVQSKQAQLAEAVAAAQAAYDAAKAEVAKVEQAAAAAEKGIEGAQANVKKAQELVVQATADHAATVKQIGVLDVLMPALNETLAKAEEAAGRAPGDGDVTAYVTQTKALIAKKVAEVDVVRKTAVAKAKAIEAAKAQVPAAEQKVVEAKAAAAAAKKKVAEATAGLKPLTDNITAAKAASSEASKTVEAAKKEVDALKAHPAT